MPVYHYTFHAYGSWMPDRTEGFNLHGKGWRPPDLRRANEYRERMQTLPTNFTKNIQQHVLKTLIASQRFQDFQLYACASDVVHIHCVVGWRDCRKPVQVRSQIKTSLTRALNQRFGKRQWFVAKAGQNVVLNEEHLSQLVQGYLPKHSGVYWRRDHSE